MHKFKQLLCLLLVVSSLFILFSVNALASGNTSGENLIDSNISNWTDVGSNSSYYHSPTVRYLGNDTNYFEITGNSKPVFLYDVTEFLKIGESYRFTFSLPTTDGVNSAALNSCIILWGLTDDSGLSYPTLGEEVFFLSVDKNNKSNYLGKTVSFEFTYTQGFKNTLLCLNILPGEGLDSYNYLQLYISNVKLERIESEEEGLLKSIIEWLRNLKDTILGGFSSIVENLTIGFNNLKNGLVELKNNIIELPTKIVNGIKNLFVPSSNYFELKMDDIQSALEENLGAVYQVSNLLDEFFTNFNADSTQNVIEVPLLTVDLLGYPFSIGGWSVPLVPDNRLQFLADACKFIIGVLTTFAFLYGLRKKYDEIVGGGED